MGTQKREFSEEQLLNAIDKSKGNMSLVAARLGCSWATARKYTSECEAARAAFIGETETMLDMAEQIVNASLESADMAERLQTAKWLLAIKGGSRGYGRAVKETVLEEKGPFSVTW